MLPSEVEVSIVIPTHNRAAVLGRCLCALSQQTVSPEAFEVIVSDDGSTDDTRAIAGAYASGAFQRLTYLKHDSRGAGAARNRAIEQARGRLLLMLNDDTIATAKLVEAHLRAHRQHPAEETAVLGRLTIAPELPRSVFSDLHLDARFSALAGGEALGWNYFLTCNLSVHRLFLLEHGAFDESIRVQHEDIELGQRLSRYGLTVRYCPEALAYHYHFVDEGGFLRSARQDGKSLAIWHKKAPHLREELASAGFYPALPPSAQVKYLMADCAINRLTIPLLLRMAGRLSRSHKGPALTIYRKVYQAIKRRSIREELEQHNT